MTIVFHNTEDGRAALNAFLTDPNRPEILKTVYSDDRCIMEVESVEDESGTVVLISSHY